MILTLTMPQFGESITQSRIVRWLKNEGDSVSENEPLIEMETEKAVFSYESPFCGRLIKILEREEKELAVGAPLAQFEVSEADGKKYQNLGVGISPPKSMSPLIKSLAKEYQITLEEIEKIKGSGPAGHMTKDDFLKYVQSKSRGIKTIPLSPIRARIADNMILSKKTIPHAGCGLDVDMSSAEKLKTKEVNYLVITLFAILETLKKHPLLNSSLKEQEGKRWIEEHEDIHLGIATATEKGLMVPVIRRAQTLSLVQLSKELVRLVEAGRQGKLGPQELTGATFTVNNTGALGSLRSSQIIPTPQVAILAMNRVEKVPRVVGDQILIRPVMALDLAFDHRLIDGDEAIRFLVDLKGFLEN